MKQFLAAVSKLLADAINITYRIMQGTDVNASVAKYQSVFDAISLINLQALKNYLYGLTAQDQADFLTAFKGNLTMDDPTLNAVLTKDFSMVITAIDAISGVNDLISRQKQVSSSMANLANILKKG